MLLVVATGPKMVLRASCASVSTHAEKVAACSSFVYFSKLSIKNFSTSNHSYLMISGKGYMWKL
jgi:hypothetical protein